jgi:putative N6-adenine-specific DNA methylase
VPAERSLHCFAVAAPGLEPLVGDELRGLRALYPLETAAPEPGGVGFRAGRRGLYAANLHLRIASRVLVRVGTFHASAFHELERHATRLPWAEFTAPGQAIAFRVTSRKSRLYHQDAVAERLLAAAGAPALPAPTGLLAPQEFIVRLFRDECTVSADASGELLHRRGYRLAVGKAPLRETLAAAMLAATGWPGGTPLVDPMCGSGTIPIEAALFARRIPPGLQRAFAFQRWPEYAAAMWEELLAASRARILPHAGSLIVGSDRDAGAVAAASANAARVGVANDARRQFQPSSHPPRPGGSSPIRPTVSEWGSASVCGTCTRSSATCCAGGGAAGMWGSSPRTPSWSARRRWPSIRRSPRRTAESGCGWCAAGWGSAPSAAALIDKRDLARALCVCARARPFDYAAARFGLVSAPASISER